MNPIYWFTDMPFLILCKTVNNCHVSAIGCPSRTKFWRSTSCFQPRIAQLKNPHCAIKDCMTRLWKIAKSKYSEKPLIDLECTCSVSAGNCRYTPVWSGTFLNRVVIIYGRGGGGIPKITRTQNVPPLDNRTPHFCPLQTCALKSCPPWRPYILLCVKTCDYSSINISVKIYYENGKYCQLLSSSLMCWWQILSQSSLNNV